MESRGIKGVTGKQHLIDSGQVGLCRDCPFLRSCWNMSDYEKSR
jgi:hypothetical protein